MTGTKTGSKWLKSASLVVLCGCVLLRNTAVGFFVAPRGPFKNLNYASVSPFENSKLARRKGKRGLTMVIDRMSDECINGLMEGHKVGNSLGVPALTSELLLVGMVARPERAGRVLSRYGVVRSVAKKSAVRYLKASGWQVKGGEGEDDASPLPFGQDAKVALNAALAVAEKFDSEKVHSEHVLLALLGYNFGDPIDMSGGSTGAANVLSGVESVGEEVSIFEICEEVVEDMTRDVDEEDDEEVVVIGGGAMGSNTLEDVGVDMTQMALDDKFDRVFGREDEIRIALRTLGRRRKNNPCLIGDPGVGKTAIVEALAQVLASSFVVEETSEDPKLNLTLPSLDGPFRNPFKKREVEVVEVEEMEVEEDLYVLPKCPKTLAGFRLIRIELASLVAGTRNRGDFEERVQRLIEEASNNKVILFIDEIHNLIGTGGGGDGAMNAANLIKPALARGELRLIGATTTPEYRRYIEKDGALERRFQPLRVKEPSVEQTVDILQLLAPSYGDYHRVKYTPKALVAAAKLSDRYVSDRFLPDKAIDLIDEAGSMLAQDEESEETFVTESTIATVVSEITGIPTGQIDTEEKSILRNLNSILAKRIKGQDGAIAAVVKAVRRSRTGMRDGDRPIANFLFFGPTGVGKTELCKALADAYFGAEKAMVRIDMSEYMDRFSTSRLIGSPPGYVGYEEGGQLTEAVRRDPFSLVLFDEIDKAHEDVLNLLLQLMDDGMLTDGKGRNVNFKNTIVVMTSNIGAKEIVKQSEQNDSSSTNREAIQKALEEALKPEILNRIDRIVSFQPLSLEHLRDISANVLQKTADRAAADQNITINIGADIVEQVTQEGFLQAKTYGARPIKRAAQRYLEDTMSEAIVQDYVNEKDTVDVQLADPREIEAATGLDDVRVVKITNLSSSEKKRNPAFIPVEKADESLDPSETETIQQKMNYEAMYREVPPRKDDKDDTSNEPPKDPNNVWE